MKPTDAVIGGISAFFMAAWVVYLIIEGRTASRCRAGFNNAKRFCDCGGERAFDGCENGMCRDHCIACGKVAETPVHVFTHGHQCNEHTIQANGRCNGCGRKHDPRFTQHAIGLDARTD